MYSDPRARAAFGLGTLALGVSLAACTAQTGASTTPNEDSLMPSASPTASPEPISPSTAGTVYVDGEYSATGWYGSLPSHQDVTLTVNDDVVTGVEITTPAENETSLGYQQRFAEALPGAIVGRSLDEIQFDRLAGSSGCSEGFMDALAQIKDQAAS